MYFYTAFIYSQIKTLSFLHQHMHHKDKNRAHKRSSSTPGGKRHYRLLPTTRKSTRMSKTKTEQARHAEGQKEPTYVMHQNRDSPSYLAIML